MSACDVRRPDRRDDKRSAGFTRIPKRVDHHLQRGGGLPPARVVGVVPIEGLTPFVQYPYQAPAIDVRRSGFGGRILRLGFITEGGRQGVALPALMVLTEHRSIAQATGYFQAGDASSNPAARLHDL